MSLDPFDSNNHNDDNIGNELDPEYNLKPEAKEARQDVINTAINNMSRDPLPQGCYKQKARNYAEKFGAFGIEDWLQDGREVMYEKPIERWANTLPYPDNKWYFK